MGETMPYRGGRGAGGGDPPTVEEPGSRPTAFDETLPTSSDGEEPGEGSKVGRYDVTERVGAGGMGVVYRAYDPELHREVALKLLKAPRAGGGQGSSKRRKRLLREARAMAQLSHPNVIPVYDVGEYGAGLYVAMEFVEGANARDWLKAVQPPWRRTLGVFRAAGRGLAAAHNAGLVHRDFKPANVLVGDDGRVRVLDFGLARAVVDEPEPEVSLEPHHDPETDAHWSETLTADGTILGTPVYMAPEQYAGKPADARSDQYSYCIALYEALYGQLPFAMGSIKQQARAKYRGEIIDPPADSPVPQRLFEVLRRGLSTRPDDRFPTMPDLLRELRTVNEVEEPSPRWRAWAVVGGVISVTAAVLIAAALQEPAAAAPAVAACPDGLQAVADTWGEGPRQRLREAFASAGTAGAEERFEALAHQLDEHAAAWADRYDRACNDPTSTPRDRRLREARLACLERHRIDLAALVESLAEPTAVVVHRAASAVHALPSMEDCDDPRSLLTAEVVDAAQRERLAAFGARIGRARALRATGRPDAAREEIDAVIEEAGAEDLRSISGLALLERARLHHGAGDLASAELDLRAAYFNAVADRRARVAATAAIGMVDLLAARGQGDEALRWSEHARANLDALGAATELEAALGQALAQVRGTTPPTPEASTD